MSEKFFEALERAKITDSAMQHAAELERLLGASERRLEVAERRLATCRRAMADAVKQLNDWSVGRACSAQDLFALADGLASVAAGTSGLDGLPGLSEGVTVETASLGPPGHELTTARASITLVGAAFARSQTKAIEKAKDALRRGVALLCVVLLASCGRAPAVKPPTAAEACARAVACGVDTVSEGACEFCVECLMKVNRGKLGSLPDLRAVECAFVVRQWGGLLAQCAGEWVPGSRCGNSRGEEVK